jgi:hypothetical protein
MSVTFTSNSGNDNNVKNVNGDNYKTVEIDLTKPKKSKKFVGLTNLSSIPAENIPSKNLPINQKKGESFSGAKSETKKSDLDLKTIEEMREQIKKISEKLLEKQEEIKREEKIEEIKKPELKPIKPLSIEYGQSTFLLKSLGEVWDPLKMGNTNYPPELWRARVGTLRHFHIYDRLISNGVSWEGIGGIKWFLDETAKVVYNDLGINPYVPFSDTTLADLGIANEYLISEENEKLLGKDWENYIMGRLSVDPRFVNKVMTVLNGYPLADRMEKRIEEAYENLKETIRNSSQSNPFLPGNISEIKKDPSKLVCAPKVFDFKYNGKVYKDFLRHWNHYDPKSKHIRILGNSITITPECVPPESLKHGWVPLKYREEIYRLFGLNEYKYIDPEVFDQLLYSVAGPVTSLDSSRAIDADGYPYVTINFEGKPYKVYYAKLKLNYPICADEFDKGLTLREWCAINLDDKPGDFLLRLMYVLMNLPVPENEGHPNAPGTIRPYIYETQVGSKVVKRMYADVPLSVIQRQALLTYGIDKSKNPTAKDDDCMETFIQNIYQQCVALGYDANSDKSKIDWPQLEDESVSEGHPYYDIIKKLFEYGAHYGCSVPEIYAKAQTSKILSEQTPKQPNKINIESIKKADASGIEIARLAESFSDFAKRSNYWFNQ